MSESCRCLGSNTLLEAPSMLLVGATGRNVGKTEFACSVIAHHSRGQEIVGVKVTSIRDQDGSCPRGGSGCGVCSSLEGEFSISQESGGPPEKDTSRMLAAGASKVFWLRCMEQHLGEGALALLNRIGRGTLCVCESNSLRTVVEPGLFLMFTREGIVKYKDSAKAVMNHVDRLVTSDGQSFDLDPSRIEVAANRWGLKENASIIILAGGDSSRMGTDKSLLPIRGRPIIQTIFDQVRPHFEEVLISSNSPEKYRFLEAPVVPDLMPNQGPLMGIISAVITSSHQKCAVIACDIPKVDIPLLRRMLDQSEGYDAVIPRTADGRYEPLYAIYDRAIVKPMRQALGQGARKISAVFDIARVRYFELGETYMLPNLNTIADYNDYVEGEHDNS